VTEAEALYQRLEQEVVPSFTRATRRHPTVWVARIRESMARLTPRFSATAVREYTEEHYLPARQIFVNARRIAAQQASRSPAGGAGREMGDGSVCRNEDQDEGEQHKFDAQIYFSDLDHKTVRVELYVTASMAALQCAGDEMRSTVGCESEAMFQRAVSAARRQRLYSARDPRQDGAAILWKTHESCGSDDKCANASCATISRRFRAHCHSAGSPSLWKQECGAESFRHFQPFRQSRPTGVVRPSRDASQRFIDLDSARHRTGDVCTCG